LILIDANILMYAAGAPHPHKAPSAALLQRVVQGEVEAAIDAEVLQEILHRYRSIGRWQDGRRVYDLARDVMGIVIPVTGEVLDEARRIMDVYQGLTARDALHAAACQVTGAAAICSFDRDFDVIAGLKRLEPQQVP
jgi:predicted nucleic acid-binding protein